MMRKITLFSWLIVSCLFTACLKDEIPVERTVVEGEQKVAIEMGNDYRKQVYFNLMNNTIVSQNNKETWDIGFETGEEGWHVITNTANNVFAFQTNQEDLNAILSKDGYTAIHHFDSQTGNLDSTAIGDWTDGKVRLLDLGIAANGQYLGWYKIKIMEVTPTSYTFQYAEISESSFHEFTIEKDADYNFVYFNLRQNKVVEVAPKKDAWDLVFTQYIEPLTEPVPMDYLVTGVLTNRYLTTSVLLTDKDYTTIDLVFAQTLSFSTYINTIGYGWKDIGLDEVMGGGTPSYTIYPNNVYIVKDQHDQYFKIKFIDFYSENGQKGTPTFIYEWLQ